MLLITGVIILAVRLSKLKKEKAESEAKLSSELQNAQLQLEEATTSWTNEKQSLIEKHQHDVEAVQEECKHAIKIAREEIESRQEVLSKLSEKELLVKTMLALDSYADRLARIEMYSAGLMVDDKTSHAVDAFTEKMATTNETLTRQLERVSSDLASKISVASNEITDHLERGSSGINKKIDARSAEVILLVDRMEDTVIKSLEAVLNKIDTRLDKSDVVTRMGDLLTAVRGIQNYLKTGLDIPDYSDRLEGIESRIKEVISKVETIESDVDNIDRTADNIAYKLGNRGINTMEEQFDDLERLVREAIEAAESAKSAAESAEYAAQNSNS